MYIPSFILLVRKPQVDLASNLREIIHCLQTRRVSFHHDAWNDRD